MTRLKGATAVFLLFLAAVPPAPGQDTLALTVSEAVKIAVRENLDMRKACLALKAEQRRYANRASVFLPSFDLSASLSSPTVDASSWSGGFSTVLSMSLGADRFSRLRQSSIDLAAASARYGLAQADTRREVRKAFYALLLIEEQERLLEGTIASARSIHEVALYDYEAGRIAEYELLNARLSYLTALPALETFRLNAAAERESFLRILGLPTDTPFALEGSLDETLPVPEEESALSVVLNHGSLKLLEIQRTRQQEAVRKLYDRYYPTLNIGIAANLIYPDPGTLRLFQPGYQGKAYALSVSVDLTDFLPFSDQAESLASGRESVALTDLDIGDRTRELESTVKFLYGRLEKSIRDLEVYLFNLELAEEYYRIVQTEYQTGRVDLLDMEEAEVKLQRARVELLEKKAARIDVLIDLEYYTGETSTFLP